MIVTEPKSIYISERFVPHVYRIHPDFPPPLQFVYPNLSLKSMISIPSSQEDVPTNMHACVWTINSHLSPARTTHTRARSHRDLIETLGGMMCHNHDENNGHAHETTLGAAALSILLQWQHLVGWGKKLRWDFEAAVMRIQRWYRRRVYGTIGIVESI